MPLNKQLTFTEVINTLISESIVIPLPRKLGLNQTLGGQGLHSLDDFEVRNINFGMLGKVVVLGGDKGTILEKSRVDGLSVLLGNKHNGF
jgi:hypothetical protein